MSVKPNKKKWHDEEIALLEKLYGTLPNDELLKKHFPDKSKSSLKGQVEKWNLGKKNYWSDREVELLKTLTKHNLPSKTIA